MHSKAVRKTLLYALLIICASFARTRTLAVSPFAFGLFVALVYCKVNLWWLTPVYVGAVLLGGFSAPALVLSLCTPIALFILYFVRAKRKKNVSLFALLSTATASILPAFLMLEGTSSIFRLCAEIVLAFIVAYCSTVGCYAVVVRGLRFPLNRDEYASLAVVLSGIALGLFRIQVFGYTPFYTVAAFCLLLSGAVGGVGVAVCFAALFSLGGLLGGGYSTLFAVFTLSAMVGALFKGGKRIFAVTAFGVGWLLVVYWLHLSENLSLTVGGILGALVYAFLPRKTSDALLACFSSNAEGRSAINRTRLTIYRRLFKIGEVFREISSRISGSVTHMLPAEENIEYMATSISREHCVGCAAYYKCYAGGKTPHELFGTLLHETISKGKANMLDAPREILQNCRNAEILLDVMAGKVAALSNTAMLMESTARGKVLVAEHLRETALLLQSVAEQTRLPIGFDKETESMVIQALSYVNIVCKEAILYCDKDNVLHLTAILREGDQTKEALLPTICSTLKQRFIASGAPYSCRDGTVGQEFVSAPRFDAVYGYQARGKDGNKTMGDTKTIHKISSDKVLAVIGDGMGSGTNANTVSTSALNLIEAFFSAGFSTAAVTSLTNKLLTLNEDETFSTLDVCLIDLRSLAADFVKLGACPSFVVGKNGIRRIDNKRPPVGIVDNVFPLTERLLLAEQDMIIMVSDGLYDLLGDNGIATVVNRFNTINPATLAKALLETAGRAALSIINGKTSHPYPINDDMTALCIRVFRSS